MSYIAVYVAAVHCDAKEAYLAHIRQTTEIFKRHGALRCVECWGDEVPDGEVTSFPLAVKCEPGEEVVFGFVEWASKRAHDEGMGLVMATMKEGMKAGTLFAPPLDGKRLIFGSERGGDEKKGKKPQ